MAPLALTLALLPMAVVTVAIEEVSLDMALDSFDDQYRDCGPAMTEELPALNRSEFQQNPRFVQVWDKAAAVWQSQGAPVSPLSPPKAITITALTMSLYSIFSEKVLTVGRSRWEYRDNFHYKTLHFLLTQALGTLKEDQGRQCRDVFWGVGGVHFMAVVVQQVRFGYFILMPLSENVAQKNGTDAMFQVHTCHGVNIVDFSYSLKNCEVLIPPFETFKVINVTWEGEGTRVQLSSTGTYSNCSWEWLRGDSTGDSLGQWGHPAMPMGTAVMRNRGQ